MLSQDYKCRVFKRKKDFQTCLLLYVSLSTILHIINCLSIAANIHQLILRRWPNVLITMIAKLLLCFFHDETLTTKEFDSLIAQYRFEHRSQFSNDDFMRSQIKFEWTDEFTQQWNKYNYHARFLVRNLNVSFLNSWLTPDS